MGNDIFVSTMYVYTHYYILIKSLRHALIKVQSKFINISIYDDEVYAG